MCLLFQFNSLFSIIWRPFNITKLYPSQNLSKIIKLVIVLRLDRRTCIDYTYVHMLLRVNRSFSIIKRPYNTTKHYPIQLLSEILNLIKGFMLKTFLNAIFKVVSLMEAFVLSKVFE